MDFECIVTLVFLSWTADIIRIRIFKLRARKTSLPLRDLASILHQSVWNLHQKLRVRETSLLLRSLGQQICTDFGTQAGYRTCSTGISSAAGVSLPGLALALALAYRHFSLLSSSATRRIFQACHNYISDWPRVAIIFKVREFVESLRCHEFIDNNKTDGGCSPCCAQLSTAQDFGQKHILSCQGGPR